MMFLMFHLGKDRYVLEARHVIEVLPLLELEADSGRSPRRGRYFQLSRPAGPGD